VCPSGRLARAGAAPSMALRACGGRGVQSAARGAVSVSSSAAPSVARLPRQCAAPPRGPQQGLPAGTTRQHPHSHPPNIMPRPHSLPFPLFPLLPLTILFHCQRRGTAVLFSGPLGGGAVGVPPWHTTGPFLGSCAGARAEAGGG